MFKIALVWMLACGSVFAEGLEAAEKRAIEPGRCEAVIALERGEVDRSGCCSHHGGVCGCAGGRQQCCDGALSPSCTCNHEDHEKLTN